MILVFFWWFNTLENGFLCLKIRAEFCHIKHIMWQFSSFITAMRVTWNCIAAPCPHHAAIAQINQLTRNNFVDDISLRSKHVCQRTEYRTFLLFFVLLHIVIDHNLFLYVNQWSNFFPLKVTKIYVPKCTVYPKFAWKCWKIVMELIIHYCINTKYSELTQSFWSQWNVIGKIIAYQLINLRNGRMMWTWRCNTRFCKHDHDFTRPQNTFSFTTFVCSVKANV